MTTDSPKMVGSVGDAEVDRAAAHVEQDAAVLRQARLADVQVGQDLDARHQRVGQMERRGLHFI
jgi:hypothetical protein